MFEKLEAIKQRRQTVEEKLSDPAVVTDMKLFTQLSKEYKELEPLVNAYEALKVVFSNINNNKELLETEKDEEFRELAKADLDELTQQKEKLEEQIKWLMVPKDPEDEKNCVVEIRAGTGGDEASLFAGDLYRMYTRYCESRKWKMEVVDVMEGTVGGYKEVIFNVSGSNVYGDLKYESGVHRVQRVPQTESQGRVHTSAATVMVLPEADELDVQIAKSDLRVDSCCSSGPGGQSVNTTYSAIRLTHIPTGIIAQCQDQKSKLKNYDKALSVLRSRLYEMELQKRNEADSSRRKSLVSSSDRSAKIRTYNYPQGRVTDHRISLTLYNLQSIVDGDIQEIIDALKLAENAEKLKAGSLSSD